MMQYQLLINWIGVFSFGLKANLWRKNKKFSRVDWNEVVMLAYFHCMYVSAVATVEATEAAASVEI